MGSLRVAELFAGVGGFRLGLERAGHKVVWSNQWEPGKRKQWASECYVQRFGPGGHVNADIAQVDPKDIPDHDLLVGGFPCQDYSVAATLDKSHGIQGKKGVLWWEIRRIVAARRPAYLLLENVDRLLKSPARQRGRDFAILLASLASLGYAVEWRVLNAADHGFPQRRRRVFLFAAHDWTAAAAAMRSGAASPSFLDQDGFFARAFPVVPQQVRLAAPLAPAMRLPRSLAQISAGFAGEFRNAGVMAGRAVWTRRVESRKEAVATIAGVLGRDVPAQYFVPEAAVARWRHLKGAKREERVAANGHRYLYAEGAIPFPDPVDQPARTLLTGEGSLSPSRSGHLVQDPQTGRLRVLTPAECERLDGFPDGWTEGMPERWRYFTMGNALVVGLVERMGHALARLESQADLPPVPQHA